MAGRNARGRRAAPVPPVAGDRERPFPGEAGRVVVGDREVVILPQPDGTDERPSPSWLLVAMRNGLCYTVEYSGTLEQAFNLAHDLSAPNLASHEMRAYFELRRVNLTSDLAEATGQAFIEVPLLNVQWVPNGSLFVVGNSHRLTLNPGIVVASGAGERRRNEWRGGDSARHAAIAEDRDVWIRAALKDTSEPPAPRY